jgi:hypothetical protein
MRRLPAMLASASAAALATAAITVAVPALAGNAGGDRTEGEFQTCLREHGLSGVPDGPDLKPWLGARLEHGDAVAERAMAACAREPAIVEKPGPSEERLRRCLTSHGVTLPGGDSRALKTWLLEHGDDAADRDAMKACGIVPPDKATEHGPCAPGGGVARAPAGKAASGGSSRAE